jgi:hypothetical protein
MKYFLIELRISIYLGELATIFFSFVQKETNQSLSNLSKKKTKKKNIEFLTYRLTVANTKLINLPT